MAMIAPLTGTTSDYQSVVDSLILNDREIGVEIASREDGSTYSIVRQGNGRDKFFDLPKLFDQSAYEDAMEITISNAETVTQLASETATKAAEAQVSATAASASETKAKASETASKTSETNAKSSEEAAKSYMDSAEEYKNQAFSATPEGYEVNMQKLADMDIQTATGENFTLADTKSGGIKLNSIKGKSVQDGEPTPDYPIAIQSVGDGGNVKVTSCGKNLLNVEDFTLIAESNNYKHIKIDIGKIPDGDYVLTYDAIKKVMASGHEKHNISLRILNNGKYLPETNNIDFSTSPIIKFKAEGFNSESCIYVYAGVAGNTAGNTVSFSNFKLEKGTVATAYEPYHSTEITIPLSEPLRSIGDVKDEIVMRDGKWGVLRRIGVTEFDGSSDEQWRQSSVNTKRFYIKLPNTVTYSDVKCSQFKKGTSDFVFGTCRIDGDIDILIDTDFSTIDELRTHLQSVSMLVIYILATPTFEPFSDQTPFYGLSSFDTVTNIITDQTIEPTMELEYGKSMVGAYTLENHSEIAKQSSLVDTVTGKSGVLSLEDGILCIKEA